MSIAVLLDRLILAYRRWAWPRRTCKWCAHSLAEHWWEEPEFCCRAGWFDKAGRMMQSGGCPCGEFVGLDWFDVKEALGPDSLREGGSERP